MFDFKGRKCGDQTLMLMVLDVLLLSEKVNV